MIQMDDLLEFVVAGIILASGAGIALVLLGLDPEIGTVLISGVTRIGVIILVVGVMMSIPYALVQKGR